jgi:hypothetical protein
MEELPAVTGTRRRAAACVVTLVLALGSAAGGRADEAELSRAVKALGVPSALWGRLAVEEESPDGAWTPLAGVAVTLYPYTAGLATDLERIRDGARASGRDYDTAIARLQERLGAHASQVGALTGTSAPTRPAPQPAPAARPPVPPTQSSGLFGRPAGAPREPDPARAGEPDGEAPPSSAGGLIRRATSDPAGLFVFGALPAGDWLVVAIQTSAYSAPHRPPSSSSRRSGISSGRLSDGFLERERPQAKEAEVWVIRVRVAPDQPTRVLLTDRSRFMVGPSR